MKKKEINKTRAPLRTELDVIESASVTALMRYLLSKKEKLLKNPDYLGHYFVNGKWREYLKDEESSIKKLQNMLPGCIYYHLIRTKHFDNSLKNWAMNNKNSQLVILGSGFDTRSIRFEDMLQEKNISVYEVDLKAMLEFKKNIIRTKLDFKHFNDVKYVSCNFTVDNVMDKLVSAGFEKNKSTYVLWEGVTFFLTQTNVEYYLKLFRENIKEKIQIVFDYAFEDYINGDLEFYGAKELYDILIEIKEPHLFGVNYENMENFARKNKYKVKSNLTSFMMEGLYLKNKKGESVGTPHGFHGIVELIN